MSNCVVCDRPCRPARPPRARRRSFMCPACAKSYDVLVSVGADTLSIVEWAAARARAAERRVSARLRRTLKDYNPLRAGRSY